MRKQTMKARNLKKQGANMAFAFLIVLTFGCAIKSKDTAAEAYSLDEPRRSYTEQPEGAALTRFAAQVADAHRFTEIQFEPGSSILTISAAEILRNTILTSNSEGRLDKVIVMSWSDEELPDSGSKGLSKVQRDLAKERGRSIERFVKKVKAVDVDTYSMAEKSSVFSKLFNTQDNRLKKTLIAAGLPTTADRQQNRLQYPSKASHAVVMIKIH
jgi:hypothetical protein